MSERRADWLLGGSCFVAAAALGLAQAALRGAWTDEAATVFALAKPLAEIARHDVNPPGSYALFKVWRALGTSLFHLRALSALLFGASAAWTYVLGARLRSRAVGATAAAFFIAAPLSQFMAAQVRWPMLLTATLLAATLALRRFALTGSRRDAAVWVAFDATAFSLHYFAAFVLLGHAVFLFAARRRLINPRRAWLSLASLGALTALWLPLFLPQLQGREAAGGGEPVPYPLLLPLAAVYLTQGFHFWLMPAFWRLLLAPSVDWWPALMAAPFALLLVCGAIDLARRGTASPDRGMLLCLALVPPAAFLAASLALRLFAPHYFLPFLPFLALLAADGAWSLAQRHVAAAAALTAAALTVFLGGAFELWMNPNAPEGWRPLATTVAEAADEGDAVLLPNLPARLCWQMSQPRELPTAHVTAATPGVQIVGEQAAAATLGEIAARHRRALFVYYYPERFDPTGAIERETVRLGGTIVTPPGPADPRVGLRLLYLRSPFAPGGLSPMIRFPNGPQHPLQLADGWQPSDGRAWWTGRRVQALLPRPQNGEVLRLDATAPLGLFGNPAPTLTATLNGRPFDARVGADGRVLIANPTDVPDEPWLVITIQCSRTFVSDDIFHDGDRREKCLLVERLGWSR
jgi:4-amino-4-deoxy-L-arabinose transferase-like glycosyltransferase